MKTLFLHIGIPKTGTSSIQKFCATNRAKLEKNGYCYPQDIRAYPGISPNRNGHFLMHFDKNNPDAEAESRQLFEQGMEQIHDCFQTFDNVVLSDEGLWMASGRQRSTLWEELKEDAKAHGYIIKIIVYLRRQDQFLSSRYNQRVKHSGLTQAWDKHVASAPESLGDVLDYAAKLSRMEQVFGTENIYVRRFNRSSFFGGSIYADFFQCLGLELTEDYQQLEADANLALKGNTFEIMRVVNTMKSLDEAQRAYLRRIVSSCSKEAGKHYSYTMFSKEEAEEFISPYRQGNERIAETFIRDGQPLFDYEIEDTLKWEKQNPYMVNDIVRVFSAAVCQLHGEIQTLQEENRIMRQQYQSGFFQKVKRRIRRLLGSKA